MMRDFEIEVQKLDGAEPDAPAGIAIGSGSTVFTRLLRQGANAPDDRLDAQPGQLAFWLVDNWWRLRFECVPPSGPTADWRLAHDLSSMGGYAWPRLAVWGEGDRVGLSSRSDPAGVVGPVRYLTDALIYVPAGSFEAEVDRLLAAASSEQSGWISDFPALYAQVKALNEERADPDLYSWRRLEAQLGYDVDEAPEPLMDSLSSLQRDYGEPAVGEAALAAQGANAAAILEAEIAAASERHWQCDLERVASSISGVCSSVRQTAGLTYPPWRIGEIAAAAVLREAGHKEGHLSNAALADILRTPKKAFDHAPAVGRRPRLYGLRLRADSSQGEIVALASRWPADRRFEFSRALGDAIWAEGERLGPLTRAKSERQKFQRAFAQSLLCPYEALVAYIGDDLSDGAISAAGRHFLVSERLVKSVLVNKRILDRQRLLNLAPLPAAHGFDASAEFDEVMEAA